jgi:hypothetical protein
VCCERGGARARAAVLQGWCGWQPQEELINSVVVKKAALLNSKMIQFEKIKFTIRQIE